MTNALAPLSILLSFVMGMAALDDTPEGLFVPGQTGKPMADLAANGGSAGQGEAISRQKITIASKPPGAPFFFLDAEINGVRTRFLVDTGATTTVLRKSDAALAGVAVEGTTRLHTANGTMPVDRASIATLTLSGIALADVKAVVADDRLPHSLIGLDTLERMGRIVIDGSSITVL